MKGTKGRKDFWQKNWLSESAGEYPTKVIFELMNQNTKTFPDGIVLALRGNMEGRVTEKKFRKR